MGLDEYKSKRDFSSTPEPSEGEGDSSERVFVIQKHDASNLHYDLRLEKDGVLKSWAVPKGVPEKQGVKRLAIQTEDHPLGYRKFEGEIPEEEYGAGTVEIWDEGTIDVMKWKEDKIIFRFHGNKLTDTYVMIRLKDSDKNWLIFKKKK